MRGRGAVILLAAFLALLSACGAAFVQTPTAGLPALGLSRVGICPVSIAPRWRRQATCARMGLGDMFKKFRRGAKSGKEELLEVATDKEFEILLSRTAEANKMVVADFYASWCKQCFVLEPKYRKLAHELEGLATFVTIDALSVEYNQGKAGPNALKKKAGVSKYPTFQV